MNTKNKLSFLLITMLVGLGFLSYLLYKHQISTEYQMKTLYFGSLVPVSNLKKINLLLHRDIALKLYAHRDKKVVNPALGREILQTDKEVMKLWMDYATQYKSNDEKVFISHVDKNMQQLHNYLLILSKKVKNLKEPENSISFTGLTEGLKTIDLLMSKLVTYELKLAHASRKDLLAHYEETKIILFVTLVLVISLMVMLFFGISNSIKRSEERLRLLATDLHSANEELHTASITDAMTGLFNRRYFDEIFFKEIQRAHREKLALTFMMGDIDHFKKYNDFYGHPAGDVVIKKVAQHLADTFKRPSDLIFRLGGEEFGLLVVGATSEMITFMADKMIKEMKALAIEHLHSDTQNYVTLSLGLVHFEQAKVISAQELYEMTDKVLYEAKEGGRNQVVTQLIN